MHVLMNRHYTVSELRRAPHRCLKTIKMTAIPIVLKFEFSTLVIESLHPGRRKQAEPP